MTQPLRFSSAASLIVLGSMIAGCAAPQARVGSATHFGGKADENVGLATRALAALNSNNVPEAIQLAERAVAKTPNDAGFRALLGNAYFAGGRFHSAEQAYRDALTVDPSQPQVVLKLALVQIAQGKKGAAVATLNQGRDVLDASDFGLALALAGNPAEAIAVLEPAAREQTADATVRQNLALAHALAGDWKEARTIAAQDVPADQLDGRIHQWMQLASPNTASDQVASVVGVKPAAVDPGQPVQLALNKADAAQAVASASAPVVKAPAAKLQVAQIAPAAPVTPAIALAAAPVRAAVASVPPAPPPSRPTLATLASTAVAEAKTVLSSFLPHSAVATRAKPHVIAAAAKHPAFRDGKSPIVVQLGAYQSANRVMAAWNGDARKFGVLKAYLPMSARFASPKGTFYRLSVRGFSSLTEAKALCTSVRGHGGSCFVRNIAGDAPVQYASR
jgi:D-alanyl-D-alanine carboxypeptidase